MSLTRSLLRVVQGWVGCCFLTIFEIASRLVTHEERQRSAMQWLRGWWAWYSGSVSASCSGPYAQWVACRDAFAQRQRQSALLLVATPAPGVPPFQVFPLGSFGRTRVAAWPGAVRCVDVCCVQTPRAAGFERACGASGSSGG